MSQRTAFNRVTPSSAPVLRVAIMVVALLIGFGAIGAQMIRLAIKGQADVQLSVASPIADSYSRPAILDRDGRVLAADIVLPSIVADPARILSLGETIDGLLQVVPGTSRADLRDKLSDRSRRFVWIARKVSTALAEKVHNLGLPGISFRWETRRTYPAGVVAGHVIGAVDADNRGRRGVERHLDETSGLRRTRDQGAQSRSPLRLSLRLGVQHAVEDELARAMDSYGATAAAGVVMDVDTGEIAASASLPEVDPAFPHRWLLNGPIDHVSDGAYELGSVFKLITVAMGLETGTVTPQTRLPTQVPIQLGRKPIADGPGKPGNMTVRQVILYSSNVGAGRIALRVGAHRQRAFLSRIGLLGPLDLETGRTAAPMAPDHWGKAETVTIAYGHGLAVAPIQFAAAIASLVNGGLAVAPTFLADRALPDVVRKRVVSKATSASLRAMMRANVAGPVGTGRRADVTGYEIGGKTGTADWASGDDGYDGKRVVTSFAGAFPMSQPRFVVLITLFDPKTGDAGGKRRTSSVNAVPTAGRVIERIAPMLGVLPRKSAATQ